MLELLNSIAMNAGVFAFMNTPWGWPIVESLHFVGLCLLLGTVGVFDLRMLGFAVLVAPKDLQVLVPFGVAGYCLNVLTGTMFVISAPDQYLFNPAFILKLSFMLVAALNMLVFYRLCAKSVLATKSGGQVATLSKWIAGISLLAWCLVIVAGRLITYYRPPYHWCLFC